MKLEDFDYQLPPHLIAQTPAEPRDASRLMVLERETGYMSHDHFYHLTQWLRPTDLLVLNRTKVLPARLFGVKEDTGALLEVFLLRPFLAEASMPAGTDSSGGSSAQKSRWEVMLRPAKRLKVGKTLLFADQMRGRLIEVLQNGNRMMEFEHEGPFEEVLEKIGNIPLPPYITAELADQERYQTVYARESGSVAAPTAGLHFTPGLLQRIRDMGVEIVEVLLHVGLGTFRPVQQENILEHKMHSEYYEISADAARRLQQAKIDGRRVVAVGTTVVRALESWAAGTGTCVKSSSPLLTSSISHLQGWTEIFIYPGYTFRYVDALITNFHFPRSTLLMLVSAMAGRETIISAYEEAIRQGYRFYSFGDAMFIV